ncbi:hypothetical protein ACFFUW_01745 [Kurthia sibirica]
MVYLFDVLLRDFWMTNSFGE